MGHTKTYCVWFLLLLYLKIKHLNAQAVNNSVVNPTAAVNVVAPRSFDPNGGGMGYPNQQQQPGQFGYPPNNFQGNGYPPYGNQNGQQQQPGYGWNPNEMGNQGRSLPPTQNYPQYQGNGPSQQGFDNYGPRRPDYFNGVFNPSGYNNMNQNPNYYNNPGDSIMFPGGMNRPYQNGGMPLGQGGYPNQQIRPTEYPQPNGQYPPQGNFQGNPGYGSGPNYYPDVLADPNIHFPDTRLYQDQPNQFPNNNQGDMNWPNNNLQMYPPNGGPGDNNRQVELPDQGNNLGQENNFGTNQIVPGNFNGAQTLPQSSNNQIGSINEPTANDTGAVLGKPVFDPSTMSPGQVVFNGM